MDTPKPLDTGDYGSSSKRRHDVRSKTAPGAVVVSAI